jgi:hypothetical protein
MAALWLRLNAEVSRTKSDGLLCSVWSIILLACWPIFGAILPNMNGLGLLWSLPKPMAPNLRWHGDSGFVIVRRNDPQKITFSFLKCVNDEIIFLSASAVTRLRTPGGEIINNIMHTGRSSTSVRSLRADCAVGVSLLSWRESTRALTCAERHPCRWGAQERGLHPSTNHVGEARELNSRPKETAGAASAAPNEARKNEASETLPTPGYAVFYVSFEGKQSTQVIRGFSP